MRYPEFLKDNGTIGFIAPAFGCAIEPYRSRFENALNIFKNKGYQIYLGPNCYENSGIGISNKPSLCGAELNAAMTDDVSDVIITCGGGELMVEVDPYIDFEKIKLCKPKWYMGYSDNTNFTFLSNILADTASIYGPCAPSFGRQPWHSSIDDAFKLLRGEKLSVRGYEKWELYEESEDDEEEIDPLAPYYLTEPADYKYYNANAGENKVEMKGRLIGGCVDILTLLTGTRFDKVEEFLEKYKEDGFIWFLECCDLDMLSIRRAFWQMREAGWFKYVKGFLIGRPRIYGEDVMGVDQYNAVTDIIGGFNVPIIMDLDIGHLPPSIPIISGSIGKVMADGNDFRLDYILE